MLIYKGNLNIELEENIEKLQREIRTIRTIKANDYYISYILFIRWKNTND